MSEALTPAERTRYCRRWLVIGLAIGIAGMLIRIWLFQQPVNSDDVQYFADAAKVQPLSELGDDANSNSARVAVLIIPALYFQLFDAFTAFYATVYTFALLSFASLYLFSWVLSGPRAAAIAAAIWATANVAISIDTRLTPDNLGTSFALFGLTLIAWAGLRARAVESLRPRTVILAAAAGGVLLWAAFCARESFFVFGGVGVAFGLLSKRRWLVTAAVLGGLLVGFFIELMLMHVMLGDGWVRYKLAFAYRANVASAGAVEPAGGGGGGFSGYTVGDLVVRYPILIIKASRGETILHFAGLVGFLMWAVSWRQPRRLAKAACGLVAFGFLAFAIVKIDPVVPLMREKLRYYATAAPLFYLACAELIELAIYRPVNHPRLARFARWINHPRRSIAVAVLAAILLLWNLSLTSRSKEFARNGNDGHWVAAQRMRADANAQGRKKVLFTDGRTNRVTSILMERGEGWGYRDLAYMISDQGLIGEGYLLLDWKRLNANVRSGFAAGALNGSFYRVIESYPLVFRHARGTQVLDVFYTGAGVQREITPIETGFPEAWSRLCTSTRVWHPLVDGDPCAREGEELNIYSGSDATWRPPPGTQLDGDQLIEMRIVAHAATSSPLRGWLLWWPSGVAKPVRQPMGSIEIGPDAQPYAFWSYLPQDAAAFRVVLRGSPAITVDDVEVVRLSRDPLDQVDGAGEPWPGRGIPDPRVAGIAKAIGSHARAHGLTARVHADRGTARAGSVVSSSDDSFTWETFSDGADLTALAAPGYVILDTVRLGPAAHRRSRGIGNSALVVRSIQREEVIDALYVDQAPLARVTETLQLGFPAGWTRLQASTRAMEPLAAGVDPAFTNADPDDEFLYSGTDFVWRRAPGTPLAGDRFVELTGEAWAPDGGKLRPYLYYWAKGQVKPIRLPMGSVDLGPDRQRFSMWTYLPVDAESYRVALRAGAGTTVSKLEAFAHDRHELDQVQKIGDAW